MLWAANGLNMSSAMLTRDGGLDSVMARRPAPTWRLPSHSYTAPSPRGAPLWVRFMAGSFSNGDQDVCACRSSISGKIFSGDALTLDAEVVGPGSRIDQHGGDREDDDDRDDGKNIEHRSGLPLVKSASYV